MRLMLPHFRQLMAVGCWLLAPGLLGQPVEWLATESLPSPVVHPFSFELLSNNRYSLHSGFQDTLPRQALANVLWAMSQGPRLSGYRELYVATRANVYLYDQSSNTITVHKPGDERYSSSAAFEVGVAADRHEEVGFAIQSGLLAGTAFADSAGPGVASCPMKWASDHANSNWEPNHPIRMVNVYGLAQCDGFDTALMAVSSDSSLPDPHPVGVDSFELLLMALRQDSVFLPIGISLETASQLLWAGYGPTPHLAINGYRGLTVPSASMGYFLTGRVFLVREEGVDCYRNRDRSGDLRSADHRLERVAAGDRRPDLRQASGRIPSTAPVYIVVCVSDTGSYRHVQEAGFAGFQYLMQAMAMGLSGFLTMPLSPSERSAIAVALSLPSGNHPVLVFAVGELLTGIAGGKEPGLVDIVRAQPVLRRGEKLRIDYLLRRSGTIRVEVYDMLGRPVCRILEESQSAGYHSLEWDGTDNSGRRLKKSNYVLGIFSRGSVAQHKVTIF